MSTLVCVDLESSTQADGAQSSRVSVPLPEDPYEAIRQVYLDGTETESEPFEDTIDTETPESPLAIAPPIPLSESTLPALVPILRKTAHMAVRVPHAMSLGLSAGMEAVPTMSESAFRKRFRSSYESSPSMSPPDLPWRKHYHEDEGPTTEDKDPTAEDEGLTVGVEAPEEEEEEAVPGGQQQTAPVVGSTVNAPLGLGNGVLRRRKLALEEGDVYNTFEVGQGSGSALESERPERVSAFRQPILTTWTNPEDGMIYIDIPDYPPPAPSVQTLPSPEWTSGLLPISPSHFDVLSPISSLTIPLTIPSPIATPATAETKGFLNELGAQVEMQGGLIRDHVVGFEELSPALFERYDKDIGELFTRSGAVRDEIFSQRYRFRSLEYEQERVTVTFEAL
ncbi:hypothetical protein Tco_0626193 [Tanacetum coccineum]|uniref:Uncharacterized protein n=1 Tax=Tanacetum coccineum TaxID=301880 RepID=A0ABQ4WJP4_9ASTR